jgi:hypothetical protein
MDQFEHYQFIRSRSSIFAPLRTKMNIYDSVRPRANQELMHNWLMHHIDDKIINFITGKSEQLPFDHNLTVRPPAPAIFINNRWEFKCPFYGKLTGCYYTSPNGLEMQAHIQSETTGGKGGHISRNDLPSMINGIIYHSNDWWNVERITAIQDRNNLIRHNAIQKTNLLPRTINPIRRIA